VLWRQVKAHQSKIVNYCSKIHNATWYLLADFCAFTPYIRLKVKYGVQLRDITYYLFFQREYLAGYLNLGDVLKFLFGTIT